MGQPDGDASPCGRIQEMTMIQLEEPPFRTFRCELCDWETETQVVDDVKIWCDCGTQMTEVVEEDANTRRNS